MSVIIGFLTSLLTIMYLLDQLGINLGGLNPFYWYRRRKWLKQYGGDPIYAVEDPMEIGALALVAIAKVDGDLTRDEKESITAVFQSDFSLDEKEAAQLFSASAHLLGHPQLIPDQVNKVLKRNDQLFNVEQAQSLHDMMNKVFPDVAALTEEQRSLLTDIRSNIVANEPVNKTWQSGS